jgi:hypothetical protein
MKSIFELKYYESNTITFFIFFDPTVRASIELAFRFIGK